MKRISVKEAKPGMVLARPITDKQGRAIVSEGTKLNPLYISRLEKWGVEELLVDDAPAESAPGPAAPAAPAPAAPAAPAAAAQSAAKPPAAAPGTALPPGVYRGPDLAERLDRIFARVAADPLMAALYQSVRSRLLGGGKS